MHMQPSVVGASYPMIKTTSASVTRGLACSTTDGSADSQSSTEESTGHSQTCNLYLTACLGLSHWLLLLLLPPLPWLLHGHSVLNDPTAYRAPSTMTRRAEVEVGQLAYRALSLSSQVCPLQAQPVPQVIVLLLTGLKMPVEATHGEALLMSTPIEVRRLGSLQASLQASVMIPQPVTHFQSRCCHHSNALHGCYVAVDEGVADSDRMCWVWKVSHYA